MANTNTGIEWADCTWNVCIGCAKVAQGCKHCYAETMAKRLARMGQDHYAAVVNDTGWNGRAVTVPEALSKPLRWRKPRRIFVNSMSDLYHDDVPFEFIAAVYGVMAATPQHIYIELTKRPKRMREFHEWLGMHVGGADWMEIYRVAHGIHNAASSCDWPLPNVVHGYSASTQADLDAGIADLLATPSALRCLSLEPLLGPIDVSAHIRRMTQYHMRLDIAGALANKGFHGFTENGKPLPPDRVEAELRRRHEAGEKFFPMGDCDGFSTQTGCPGHRQPRIDWVIVGGESGPGARPCDVAWIRSIVEQCKAAGVPVFVKQLGAHLVSDQPSDFENGDTVVGECDLLLRDPKGADPSEWPADLRIRQFPEARQ